MNRKERKISNKNIGTEKDDCIKVAEEVYLLPEEKFHIETILNRYSKAIFKKVINIKFEILDDGQVVLIIVNGDKFKDFKNKKGDTRLTKDGYKELKKIKLKQSLIMLNELKNIDSDLDKCKFVAKFLKDRLAADEKLKDITRVNGDIVNIFNQINNELNNKAHNKINNKSNENKLNNTSNIKNNNDKNNNDKNINNKDDSKKDNSDRENKAINISIKPNNSKIPSQKLQEIEKKLNILSKAMSKYFRVEISFSKNQDMMVYFADLKSKARLCDTVHSRIILSPIEAERIIKIANSGINNKGGIRNQDKLVRSALAVIFSNESLNKDTYDALNKRSKRIKIEKNITLASIELINKKTKELKLRIDNLFVEVVGYDTEINLDNFKSLYAKATPSKSHNYRTIFDRLTNFIVKDKKRSSFVERYSNEFFKVDVSFNDDIDTIRNNIEPNMDIEGLIKKERENIEKFKEIYQNYEQAELFVTTQLIKSQVILSKLQQEYPTIYVEADYSNPELEKDLLKTRMFYLDIENFEYVIGNTKIDLRDTDNLIFNLEEAKDKLIENIESELKEEQECLDKFLNKFEYRFLLHLVNNLPGEDIKTYVGILTDKKNEYKKYKNKIESFHACMVLATNEAIEKIYIDLEKMGCINVNKQNNSVTITDKGLKTLIKARESKDKFDMEKFLKDCPTSIKTFDDFLEKFTSTDSLMCKHFILGFYIHIDEEQRREEVLKLINFINTRKEDYIGFENTLAELLAEVMTTEIETIVKLNQGMGDEWLNNLFSNALSQVEFVSNAKEMFGMMDDLQDGKVHEKLYRENPNLVIDYLRIIFPVMTKSNMIRALEKAFETGMDAIEVIERELKRLDYNDFFNDNSVSREVKDMVCETCLFSDHCDGVYCLRG